MQMECSADLLGFKPVEACKVVAAFDSGQMTADAGAMQAVNRVGGWDFDPRFINEICGGSCRRCSAAASSARRRTLREFRATAIRAAADSGLRRRAHRPTEMPLMFSTCYRHLAMAGSINFMNPGTPGFPLSAGMMSELLAFRDFIFRWTLKRDQASRVSRRK